MIDPRFANAASVPIAPGYGGVPQMPMQYHYQHHRHHGHHKHKNRNDESPISRDESIHKVDHGHHHQLQQNDGAPIGGGYGVPYSTGGFNQQQQFGGAGNFGHGNQHQGDAYGQGQPGVQTVKHRRRHHRHNRHQTVEAANIAGGGGGDQAHGVPEQLIGQRSSSVLSNQEQNLRSPAPPAEGESIGDSTIHRRHRHHHHRHHHHPGSENAGFAQTHQSHHAQGQNTVGADGYGHINEDLIFIERGDHSPHRQEPPPGYEYKGKIEVQGVEKEFRSRSRGQDAAQPYAPVPQQYAPSYAPPPQVPNCGPCPPGWQQMALAAGGAMPCPSGGLPYTGQIAGVASSTGGYGSFGGSYAAPSSYQYSGDYTSGYQQTAATGYQQTGATGYQQPSATGYGEQFQSQQTEEQTTGRAKIIEVWQKRSKSETGERQHQPSSGGEGPSFDFERFRNEVLAAIGRIPRGGPSEMPSAGRDGGTQTQIHPTGPVESRVEHVRHEAGEVRVIVQPIQPVFYMPRQTGETTAPQIGPGPGPAIQQAASGGPNIVYIPRNVYVPVIKPVFVPRERVIIRPQVVHVARPVLVDRPVPVTQRPIIIDRERPIPVPVRGGGQAAASSGGSRVVKEEFVYRDNLPVAYGGRCAEFQGGSSFGYTPSQQQHHEQHYSASSTQEGGGVYQAEESAANVNLQNQYQHSQSGSQINVQNGGGSSFHGSYSNLADVNNGAGVNIGQAAAGGRAQIEVLDAAVNPNWIKTDQSSLVRRYGRSAYDIVHKSEEVEQQMYSEIRHRTSSDGIARSTSSASYASGSGIDINGGGGGGGYAQF